MRHWELTQDEEAHRGSGSAGSALAAAGRGVNKHNEELWATAIKGSPWRNLLNAASKTAGEVCTVPSHSGSRGREAAV